MIKEIYTRRSIRKYSSKPVPETKIVELLKAAMEAPSARNSQPWQFIVITRKNIMEKIAEFHSHADMLNDAQKAILVCGDLSLIKQKEIEIEKEYMVQSCSAAIQNILLAAESVNLGAVWVALYPRKHRLEKITNLLNLPNCYLPISLVSIGYPGEKKLPADRFKKSRIHYNEFN